MPEYIEREALLNDLENSVVVSCKTENIPQAQRELNKIVSCIKQAPTADVAEVRHGEWLTRYIHNRLSSGAKVRWNVKSCSICTHTQLCVSDYCPRCGAKMNKE